MIVAPIVVVELTGTSVRSSVNFPRSRLDSGQIAETILAVMTQYGGTGSSTIGTAVVTAFGGAGSAEHRTLQALRAAIETRTMMAPTRRDSTRGSGRESGVRIGVHVGKIAAGAVAAPHWSTAVAVAARLSSNSMPDSILLTEATLRLVEHAVTVQPGPVLPAISGQGLLRTFALADIAASPFGGRVARSIFLGDLVRAFSFMKPSDEDAKRAIAAVLGFAWNEPTSPAGREPRGARQHVSANVFASRPAETLSDPAEQPKKAPEVRTVIPSTLERLDSSRAGWLVEVKPLPADSTRESMPVLEPLLVPSWSRAILSASLSTLVEEGPVDVERMVNTIVRQQAVTRLSLLPVPTMRHGVEVLTDRSPAMAPFLRDQRWLEERIARVAGSEGVTLRRFSACPSRGTGSGPVTEWERSYRPPPPGTTVVLLTDLGIGRPLGRDDWADVGEWLEFAASVHRAQCPLVAFVPYHPARWPARLANSIAVIQWDRTTTVAMARNWARPRHRASS